MKMLKWEYKQLTTLSTFDFMESLNKLGREGWELVNICEVSATNIKGKQVKPELLAILKIKVGDIE